MKLRTAPIGLTVTAVLLAAMPAFAHPGDHTALPSAELARHFAAPDHLALLALATFVVLAFAETRRRRRAARVEVTRRQENGQP